jgi:hypothetical protein
MQLIAGIIDRGSDIKGFFVLHICGHPFLYKL